MSVQPKIIASLSALKKSAQFINSLDTADFRSYELNGHAHPKITKITFSFPEFAPERKKPVHSIYSILRYSQF